MTSFDRDAVFSERSPAGGVPAGASAPPDAVGACYDAAAATINGGSHAGRTGYYATPVTDPAVMLARVTALEDATRALMIATAILRDATGDALPEHTERLQEVVSTLRRGGDGLRDVRRGLPGGGWDLDPSHFDGDDR